MRALLFLGCAAALVAQPLRIQVTTGGHSYDPMFHQVFAGREDWKVTVAPHPNAYRPDLRKRADVLVTYDLVEALPAREMSALRAYLEDGGGLVVLHHALATAWQWEFWYRDVVGGRFLMAPEGNLPASTAKAPEILTVRPVAEHPVLEEVGVLRLDDEAYRGMWISPRSRVLMETDHPNADKAVVWIGPWTRSRVVAIQLGHGPGAFGDPGFRRLVHNAIQWVAGREN
jgi:type 1 glutamine amidotransferase